MPEANVMGSVATLPCGWFALDDGGRILAANPALGRMLGIDEATLVGRPADDLFTVESRVLYRSHVFPMLKLGRDVAEVMLTLRGSAGAVDVLIYGRREPRETGAVIEFVAARLHERKRLEDQLLNARRAAEQVPGIVFQCQRKPDGAITFPYMTEAVRRLYGLAPVQLRENGERLFESIAADHRPAMLAAMAQSAATLAPWRAEYRVDHPPGAGRWHEINAAPRRQPDGSTLWHGFIADVTERRELEASVRRQLAAESASRAKSEFLARVSHELRTPLNGILGFAQLLLIEPDDALTKAQRRKIGHIDAAGRHLLLLINDMLDVTRIDAGQLGVEIARVDVLTLVTECVQLVGPMAAKSETLVSLDAPRPWHVLADASRLRQALLNLLSNAIKYGQGGEVTVVVDGDADRVAIAVRDRGPGLTPAQVACLFQPFNRLGAERGPIEGTGLGLMITRGLIELMGGEVGVTSCVGEGSVFTLRLPQAPDPA